MQLLDGQLTLSPSDLHYYLECRHLTQLDLAVLRGDVAKPDTDSDGSVELVARKGDEHEERYLRSLRDAGREVVEIPRTLMADEAAAMTEAAMRDGAEVIYQGAFLDFPNSVGGIPPPGSKKYSPPEGPGVQNPAWSGFSDFMFRVDKPSPALGAHFYEVADTKLARRTKPYFLLQLCFYSEQVARIQGMPPEYMHVVLGTNEQHRYRLAEYDAYYRTIRDQYVAELAASPVDTFPLPVMHCSLCRWSERCDAQRIEEDHLSLVAGIRRDQIARLQEHGIDTLEELAEATVDSPTPRIPQFSYDKIHHQAQMQLGHRRTGAHSFDLLQPERGRGLALLPPPDAGDLFFDMEGDPLYEDGLEYLFGSVTDAGGESFTPFWGHDRAGEKQAFEQFIDFVVARRAEHPDMHVYHYAHYEVTALKKLMGMHGTREAEIDELLRGEVFVDLYKVVRQSMRISQPSYSIKKVEAFYMEQRDTSVTDGANSIVEYERYLESGGEAQEILDAIADYNRDDCISTLKLRDWLLERRGEAEAKFGPVVEWAEPEDYERKEEAIAEEAEAEQLARQLRAAGEDTLANLLSYHWREAKPAWWIYFERIGMSSDELIEDPEAIGGVEAVEGVAPEKVDRSLVYEMSFSPQEFRIRRGDSVGEPGSRKGAGTVVDVDAGRGRVWLKRGAARASDPLPSALIPGTPLDAKHQRAALRRVAQEVLAGGEQYRSVRDVVAGVAPRVGGVEPGAPLQPGEFDLGEAKRLAAGLDDSYLFMQGPPGAGKTYSGSRMIVELLQDGKRVGVTANSHKAINNLLEAVEGEAERTGFVFTGLKKGSGEHEFDGKFIENSNKNDDFPGDYDLIAGTTWLFPRDHMDQTLDYLFVDEAGQIALADAVAVGTAARNLVLLGDPLQLPQVSQGRHPDGSDASVLEHLLGDDGTVRPERGLFLDKTWRMHPDVTKFISEVVYEGRLEAVEGCSRRTFGASGDLKGTGIRYLPVEHEGNSRSSVEEVAVVDAAVRAMLVDGTYTDENGDEDRLAPDDVLVVTPYNAQVQLLSEALPEGVRVGTVDKFQGQEAPVVFFSMATSSGDELPRNLEFLFSRNRLNVAISRAQCLAVLVSSPDLLRIRCRTIEQMQLVNALCRAVEVGS